MWHEGDDPSNTTTSVYESVSLMWTHPSSSNAAACQQHRAVHSTASQPAGTQVEPSRLLLLLILVKHRVHERRRHVKEVGTAAAAAAGIGVGACCCPFAAAGSSSGGWWQDGVQLGLQLLLTWRFGWGDCWMPSSTQAVHRQYTGSSIVGKYQQTLSNIGDVWPVCVQCTGTGILQQMMLLMLPVCLLIMRVPAA